MNFIEKMHKLFHKKKVPLLDTRNAKKDNIIYIDVLEAIIHNDNIYNKFIQYKDRGKNKSLFGQELEPEEYIAALTRYVELEQKYGIRYSRREKSRIAKLIGKDKIRKQKVEKDYITIIKNALLDMRKTLRNPDLCELIIGFYYDLNEQMLRLPEYQEDKMDTIQLYLDMNKYIMEHYKDEENNQELDSDFQKELLGELEGIDDVAQKAFKLYHELNRKLEYDNRFLAATSEEKFSEIYNRPTKDINNENPKLVCKTWAELYCSLLNKEKIPAIVRKRGGHCLVIFKANGEIFKADATEITLSEEYESYTNDLTRAKINMRPNSIITLDNDWLYVSESYKKMGYEFEEGQKYFDRLIDKFKKLTKDEENLDISILGIEQGSVQESIMDKLNIINGLISNSGLSNVELINFYNCLADNFFTDEEETLVDDVSFVKADDSQISKLIIIKNVDRNFLYLYIDNSGRMRRINPEELEKKFDKGEFFINNSSIPHSEKIEDSIHNWRLDVPGFHVDDDDEHSCKKMDEGEENEV